MVGLPGTVAAEAVRRDLLRIEVHLLQIPRGIALRDSVIKMALA